MASRPADIPPIPPIPTLPDQVAAYHDTTLRLGSLNNAPKRRCGSCREYHGFLGSSRIGRIFLCKSCTAARRAKAAGASQ